MKFASILYLEEDWAISPLSLLFSCVWISFTPLTTIPREDSAKGVKIKRQYLAKVERKQGGEA